MHGSEVARLRLQIEEEYLAAQRGLSGLAYGTSRHQFITQRMENMEKCRQKLVTLLGPEEAMKVVAETLEAL